MNTNPHPEPPSAPPLPFDQTPSPPESKGCKKKAAKPGPHPQADYDARFHDLFKTVLHAQFAAEPIKLEGMAALARAKSIVLLSWNAAVFACQQSEGKKEVDELNERLA
jgi:hypothetical protein